jgi:hypothetical protein
LRRREIIISCCVRPENGSVPLSISKVMSESEYTSVRASSGRPRSCSGLMNSGVPRMIPVAVSFCSSASARRSFARPKSITTARSTPSASRRIITFSGFRSRWTIFSSCATCSPAAMSLTKRTTSSSGSEPSLMLRSESSSPFTNGITTYTSPSCVSPRRMMWQTLACASRMPRLASRFRRAIAFWSRDRAAESTLIA